MSINSEKKLKSKILVCVGDNEHSIVAVKFVCKLSRHNGAPIQLLHIIEPVDPTFSRLGAKMRNEKRNLAEKLLSKCLEVASPLLSQPPVVAIREGFLVDEIIAAVEEDPTIAMLVIGTSHNSPTKDKIVPAISAQLGDRLLVPMLVIPGTLTEQQINELT